eukprot:CAMPEP_0175968012 /NCGR_PEP_ID=MMETSP0108-20121206/39644_1 /TAXON_ID=195067 ORGANISM="Goniomonas pacifica, Strain CCMP1869" /NCGR_SAMPLE_ID=MMETSP0108 /ASSEMBLY_ACC=CAM_ASM_000204 /LENGTH=56 /DNA_ID=CAMNT_0017296585 /DNA_START=694 /DNA_END=861 /DNA_ORIENTATION=+
MWCLVGVMLSPPVVCGAAAFYQCGPDTESSRHANVWSLQTKSLAGAEQLNLSAVVR